MWILSSEKVPSFTERICLSYQFEIKLEMRGYKGGREHTIRWRDVSGWVNVRRFGILQFGVSVDI